jgi:hypothetical protein
MPLMSVLSLVTTYFVPLGRPFSMGRALPRYGNIGQCEKFSFFMSLSETSCHTMLIVSLSLGRTSFIWASLCPDLRGLFI